MRYLPLILLLAACTAPAPMMMGAERNEVVIDGRTYVVHRKGNAVEVIRTGWVSPGQHQGVRAAMIAAVPQATGCKLVESSLQGDSGAMRGRVTCPKG